MLMSVTMTSGVSPGEPRAHGRRRRPAPPGSRLGQGELQHVAHGPRIVDGENRLAHCVSSLSIIGPARAEPGEAVSEARRCAEDGERDGVRLPGLDGGEQNLQALAADALDARGVDADRFAAMAEEFDGERARRVEIENFRQLDAARRAPIGSRYQNSSQLSSGARGSGLRNAPPRRGPASVFKALRGLAARRAARDTPPSAPRRLRPAGTAPTRRASSALSCPSACAAAVVSSTMAAFCCVTWSIWLTAVLT